jgi:hypothetical protein
MTQAKLDDKRRRAFAIAVRDGHLHQVGKCVSSRPGGVPLGGGPERTASLITRSSLIVVRRRYPCCGTRGIRHACAGRSGRLGVSQDFRPVETLRPERSGDRRRAADRHRPPRRGAAQGAAQPPPFPPRWLWRPSSQLQAWPPTRQPGRRHSRISDACAVARLHR